MGRLARCVCLSGAVVVCAALLTTASARASTCSRLCAESADGMVYRVLGEFHYTDVIGQSAVGFAFTVTNNSRQAETFEPFPGFTAQLSTGGYVQYPTGYESASAADPKCSPVATQPGVITPLGYRVKPGQTGGPWEVCVVVSPGQTVVKAVFADDNPNLHQPATIELSNVPQLRTPLPPRSPKAHARPPLEWPLPDPCNLPASLLNDFVGTSSGGVLTRRDWDTSRARATCTFAELPGLYAKTYLGYVRPPEPTGGYHRIAIPGWPGAELLDSTLPNMSNSYFWVVTFERQYHGHDVWGQTWWQGSACTRAEPSGAAIAKGLYQLFGPGPKVSVPPPEYENNQCDGSAPSPSPITVSSG